MQEIEKLALSTYEKNLIYFSNTNPLLLRKIQIFDMEELEIQPKYDLEYKNNYFDVLELSSGSYLYGSDSDEYAKKAAKSINFKKDTLLFDGMIDYFAETKQIKELKSVKEYKTCNIKDVLPIMNYAMKLAPRTTTMKKIDKFIFIGTGIGTHISEIDKKIRASEYFIIEDNLELFRLSLFVTPYYDLATNAHLHFSIAQNENEFTTTMAKFLQGSFFNNRYIKYFHFLAHSNTKLKLIQNNLAAQNHHVFPYDIQLDKFLKPLLRIIDGYKTINVSKKFNEQLFVQYPVLVLAAGPSFKKNIEWVKENQDKFIILAVSAVLNTLHAHGIKPDIVTHIDGIDKEANSTMHSMIHFDGFDAKEFLKDTIFILGSHAPNALIEMFKKEDIYFMEDSTFYYNDFGSLSTPCVGSTSALLALWLDFKEIYLLGLDLALNQKTGATHSGDHHYSSTLDIVKNDELDYVISLGNNTIPIKGNFEKIVYSTPLLITSVQSLFNSIPAIKDESQKIYNLNHGAFLNGTIPTKLQNISTKQFLNIDKKALFNQLFEIFEQHSQSGMNQVDLISMEKRLQNAKKIHLIISEYEKKSFTDENKYMYDLLGVVSDILKFQGREANNLTSVFSSFFQYTLPYIMDILNTKEVTKMTIHLKKIDAMFIDGLLNIVNKYIEFIERFLKEMRIEIN